ncbi:MAG: PstS family phosphate ABC transporter substrate-binding protein [Anaerolineales bacterium]|nr:MAG: PstS family phosphate ABC transporter substrate-binding protein [Anaerolineales bacterium]
MNRKLYLGLSALVIAGVLLAACGAPAPAATEAPSQATAAPAEATAPAMDPFSPLAVSGAIITAGSSTVFPLTERMAERFSDEGFSGSITIDSIGSGAGIERFCVAGDTDVANSSRAIRESEVASCQSIGREPIEFRVGTDALSVVVSQANDFVTDVTTEELALIFGEATNWSDVRPEWPNEPIQRFIPGTDSGTFDYFVEHVYGNDPSTILAASNTQLSEDDNVLVQGIQGSPYAVAFFGYAYYAENASTLKILSLDGVQPDDVTVEDGSYGLARPLFLYTTADILNGKPQVAAFLHFYLAFVNEEIVEVGYFPASESALQAALDAFDAAVGN